MRDTPWRRWSLAAAVFILLAVIPRLVLLDERPLHHDESQHAWYAYEFAFGKERHYTHSPILHGPAHMLLTGLAFRVAGDSITVGRGLAALASLAGVLAMIALWPRRLRLWLMPLFAVSPMYLYYSRFLRNEPYFCALALVGLLGFMKSLEGRSPQRRAAWGVLGPACWLALVAFKENALFILATGLAFALLWLAVRLLWRRPAFALRARRLIAARPASVRRAGATRAKAAAPPPRPPRPAPALPSISLPMVATLAGWAVGIGIGISFVLLIYGITTSDHSFSPLMNMKKSWDYWSGQQKMMRIEGDLHYHLPVLLTYELPVLLMLYAGLAADAARRLLRAALYAGAMLCWWFLWLGWAALGTLPGPLQPIAAFLHMVPDRSMLVLGWWILPPLVWSILALKEHRIAAAFGGFWSACALFQYAVAGEKVPWLGVHIIVPIYLAAGWVWAPRLRRAGPWAGRAFGAVIVAAVLIALLADQRIVRHGGDPRERLAYNHTSYAFDALAKRRLAEWSAAEKVKPLSSRRVVLQGIVGWPGTWYFRHTDYQLEPGSISTIGDGTDLLIGENAELQPLVHSDYSNWPWTATSLSLRDHGWTPWPETRFYSSLWKYYWLREPWVPVGDYTITAIEPR